MTGTMGERFARALAAKDFEGVTTDHVGDAQRVGYRLAVSNADGDFVVDQQADHETVDGAITRMRVLCSGWRRLEETGTPS